MGTDCCIEAFMDENDIGQYVPVDEVYRRADGEVGFVYNPGFATVREWGTPDNQDLWLPEGDIRFRHRGNIVRIGAMVNYIVDNIARLSAGVRGGLEETRNVLEEILHCDSCGLGPVCIVTLLYFLSIGVDLLRND